MSKLVGVLIVFAGAALLLLSVAGLYNSSLDSRETLLIALGVAGLVFTAVGVRAVRPTLPQPT